MKQTLFTLTSLFLITACDDKAMVTVYKKKIIKTPISCMKLTVFPEDAMITQTLQKRYHFTDSCDLTLEVSYKSGITCNSRFNATTKATTGFPSSYLKMELRRGMTLQYSYYIDLKEKPEMGDVDKGFDRLEEDLKFK